ncbi:MAG: serine/threonine-protein kinase [Zavarzinella sp.]
MHHPNIVVLYESGEFEGTHFLAMEFADGVTLEKMVRTHGQLNTKQACDYIRQCAEGLQHAYEMGVVHRDIKPSNILISQKGGMLIADSGSVPTASRPQLVTVRDRDRLQQSSVQLSNTWGTAKILDMGLARITDGTENDGNGTDDNTPLTRAGALLGTPDFIAPEQARDARKADIRSDIYSLGCTFYYLLTGKPPFAGGTDVQKLIRHQSEKPYPIEQLRPGVPPEVLRIVERMLEKRPDERYQYPRQLVDALNLVLQPSNQGQTSHPLSNTPPVADTPVPVTASPAPTSPEMKTVVMDDQQSDSPATSLGTVDLKPQPLPADIREMKREASPPNPSRHLFTINGVHESAVSSIALSPNGMFLATCGLDGKANLYDITTDEPKRIAVFPSPSAELLSIAFSPNSDYLVTGGILNGTVRVWRWDFRQSKVAEWGAYSGDHATLTSLTFSPDGTKLLASIGSYLVHWKIRGTEASAGTILRGHSRSIRHTAFTEDGSRFASVGESRKIIIWQQSWLRLTQKIVFEGHSDIMTHCSFAPNRNILATCGLDRSICLWDLDNPKKETTFHLSHHQDNVRLVKYLGNEGILVSIGEAGHGNIWDANTNLLISSFQLNPQLTVAITMREDGTAIATGTNDGKVAVYQLTVPATQSNLTQFA